MESTTQNILALVDFSPSTEKTIQKAGEMSLQYNAKCWIVHIAAPDPDFVGYDVGPQYIRDHRAKELREEHQKLQELSAELKSQGVNCESLLVQGPIYKTVTEEMARLKVDLVILGSRGHSQVRNLLVGSVCEHLLRNSKVPLLIIPKPD